jgi:hypothetical protein
MKLQAIIVAAALCAAAVPAAAQMGAPTAISPAAFATAATGSTVEIAVRVQRRVRSELRAELLEQETSERYRATGKQVRIFAPASTPIVMGSQGDVDAPGAIVFVKAVVTGKGRADAKRFVVITQYATVH